MNTVLLNTISLDGEVIIRKGSGGGGGVPINNQEKSVDITENGVTEVVADAGFTGLSKVVVNTNVASSGGGSGWTGHADVEGLKAIGWTDEDIAYYQENGVNWNEEDDEYHKVTDDNKALYGVLTADNISTYARRIVYLPKIDTSAKTSMDNMFNGCTAMLAIPLLDTSNIMTMRNTFYECFSLVCIPPIDTNKVWVFYRTFYSCYTLTHIPQLGTQSATIMQDMFSYCNSLVTIPQLDTSSVTDMSKMFSYCKSLVSIPPLDTQNVTNMNKMFSYCNSLVGIPPLDTQNVTNMQMMFAGCYSLVSIPQLDFYSDSVAPVDTFNGCVNLVHLRIKNNKAAISFDKSPLLSKESLLYLINNEAATSAITIRLASYAYTRLAEDADVVAALANHPNISISK